MFLAHNCFKVENFSKHFYRPIIFVYWPQSDFVMREYIFISIGRAKWGYNLIVQHVCGDIILGGNSELKKLVVVLHKFSMNFERNKKRKN
jgi:hypothetical protein